jgi:hypothetical protein
MVPVQQLNVPGFGWYFCDTDRYDPGLGPFRITSAHGQIVFIAPLCRPDERRAVALSRLVMKRLVWFNSA